MNLHGLASGVVAAVNPLMPVTVRVSAGWSTGADFVRAPAYETPGALVGSISGNVLTVTSVSVGFLDVGQELSGGGVQAGTEVEAQLTGAPGGAGTYEVTVEQELAGPASMTTALNLLAQIQPTTWRDLQLLDGLNVSGVRWKAFLQGQVNGIVRPEKKGGDLLVVPSGPHAGTWLIAQVMEQWPDWVLCAITLQNGG